jgi:hypothetical protein
MADVMGSLASPDATPARPLERRDVGLRPNQPEAGQSETELHPQFFIEPHSHRLTPLGAPRECVPTFAALYQNRHGRWLSATPALHLVAQPRLLRKNSTRPSSKLGDALDLKLDGGGIYTRNTIEKQEQFLQAPRFQEDLTRKMAEQARRSATYQPNERSPPRPNAVFGNLPTLGLSWIAKLWDWIDVWARFAAVIAGVYYAISALKKLLGCCLTCWSVHDGYGCTSHLMAALLPRWFTPGGARGAVGDWVKRRRAYRPTGLAERAPPSYRGARRDERARQEERRDEEMSLVRQRRQEEMVYPAIPAAPPDTRVGAD